MHQRAAEIGACSRARRAGQRQQLGVCWRRGRPSGERCGIRHGRAAVLCSASILRHSPAWAAIEPMMHSILRSAAPSSRPMNAPLHFYFDFSSPTATSPPPGLTESPRHGRRVQWRAIPLGPSSNHRQPSAGGSARQGRLLAARFRALRRHGRPAFPREPARFPSPPTWPRCLWWQHGARPGPRQGLGAHCLAAYFSQGLDLSDAAVLRSVCCKPAWMPTRLRTRGATRSLKAQLKAENDAAPGRQGLRCALPGH